ncbi:MAG: molybdopterin oxidoreductase family protein [Turicibacter sp.]|nr:molybdopterin oxidoreductase family protein [Turicibacter sp.]
MKKIQSLCNYCGLACNIDFFVEDNRVIKVIPTENYPVNKGFSCIKGLNLDKQTQVYKPNPLPRISRQDGTFEHMSWDQAIEKTAKKLKEISTKYGSESIAAISTGQMMLEEFALLCHVMRNYMKANVDGNTRLCMSSAVYAYKESFGFDAPPYTLNDLELSDTVIIIGGNPLVAQPVAWGRIRSNKNKKLIVIDPRVSETAIHADYHYPLKPKSDLKLFYILANLLIENGWIDSNYIENYTENFSEFKEFVKDYPLDHAEAETGLTSEQILQLATLIHEGKNVSFWWAMGINQGYEGTRTAQAIINISLMTGNIGRPGTGPNAITGQSNAMGSRMFSNTTSLYGGGDHEDPARRQAIAGILGIDESWLATKPTLPYNQIIEKINAGEIKALWVVCTNPRHSWVNNETFKAAMGKLELFIVQDLYDNTDSSENCDTFFPVVPGIKKEGTGINTERRLSAFRPVLKREENELSDFDVFLKMGEALGMGSLLDKWRTPRAVFDLMKKCTEGMPSDFTGIEYDDLINSKGIQWPFAKGDVLKEDERRLYEDGHYYTASKKAQFIFEKPLENPLPTTKEYPYILNTGRETAGQWQTQTRTREIKQVGAATSAEAYIYINEKLAEELLINHNDPVEIHSINGVCSIFEARVTNRVKYGELYTSFNYIETNALTPSVYDRHSSQPSYKMTPIQIKKIGG